MVEQEPQALWRDMASDLRGWACLPPFHCPVCSSQGICGTAVRGRWTNSFRVVAAFCCVAQVARWDFLNRYYEGNCDCPNLFPMPVLCECLHILSVFTLLSAPTPGCTPPCASHPTHLSVTSSRLSFTFSTVVLFSQSREARKGSVAFPKVFCSVPGNVWEKRGVWPLYVSTDVSLHFLGRTVLLILACGLCFPPCLTLE